MKLERKFMLAVENKTIAVIEEKSGKKMGEFSLDELAELIQFRYATPWNISKDILEKLMLILGDIKDAYEHSEDIYLSKETIIKNVKVRHAEK